MIRQADARGGAGRKLLVFGGFILIALLSALAVFFLGGLLVPCSWFGSPQEGACGYAGAGFMLVASAMVAFTVLTGCSICYFYVPQKRLNGQCARKPRP